MYPKSTTEPVVAIGVATDAQPVVVEVPAQRRNAKLCLFTISYCETIDMGFV
ncbi:MAG TPA: hypothetical protein VJK51_02755 [Candidatus Nanoarchaeia archaeon]|nr:hypothetical protein [Candidatus Nanoarchaeia archaeon]